MPITAYLAGPDVFFPNAREHAVAKQAICAHYGIEGRSPLNDDLRRDPSITDTAFARLIFAKDLEMMRSCDCVIANLTPFRGVSADSGTLVEVGYMLGAGKPVFGYSNSSSSFNERSAQYTAKFGVEMEGVAVEGFGLPDNLMIPYAVETGGKLPMQLPEKGEELGMTSLEVFELCVKKAAAQLRVDGAM
jgi:nucleoside 2-deoxyribosyltransferase